MNFCSRCGAAVVLRVPEGDDRPRHVCDACDTIHYQNPKLVAGCIPEWEDRILLCRRAIEPRYGKWTLPAGFMENGETTAQAAMRETLEEANARVDLGPPFTLFDIPRINQLYLIFRARLLDLDCSAGRETMQIHLFPEEEIPWQELAFPAIERTLELFFEDRRRGDFQLHTGEIRRRPGAPREGEF